MILNEKKGKRCKLGNRLLLYWIKYCQMGGMGQNCDKMTNFVVVGLLKLI